MGEQIFRVVDLETTGFQEDAEVIEMALQDMALDPSTGRWWWRETGSAFLFGADRGVPPEAQAIHHIWPEDIIGLPTFPQAGAALWDKSYIGPPGTKIDVVVAHNAEHEEKHMGWLRGSVPWLCTYKGALHAWPDAPNHKNWTLAYWLLRQYPGEWGRPATGPHRAAGDIWATRIVLTHLVRQHGVDQLLRWTVEDEPCLKVPVGEQRGKRWREIDLGLLEWFLKPGKDFKPNVLKAAKAELDRRVAERTAADRSPGPLFQDRTPRA